MNEADLEALLRRSIEALATGDHANALSLIDEAIAGKGDEPALHNNRGVVLQSLGRYADSEASFSRAVALEPRFAEAHHNLGNTLRASGRTDEAENSYRNALAINPSYANAHLSLGKLLLAGGRFADARESFMRVIELRPDGEALSGLGLSLQRLDRHAEAVEAFARAVARGFRDSETLNAMGNSLVTLLRHDEAAQRYAEALALKPSFAEAHSNLGNLHLELGRIKDAEKAFTRAIALAPNMARYHRYRAETRRFHANDPELLELEQLARGLGSVSEDEKVELHFALGKAYADIDDSGRSFDQFLAGNALKRRLMKYDETAALTQLDDIRSTFTASVIGAARGRGNLSRAPIFIVGMPRSGTSLAEQILASHPVVFGAGELTAFERALASRVNAPFPKSMLELDDAALAQIGVDYLADVSPIVRGASSFTDKMPANFRYVGAIHMALPNARIIHMRRDPIDTCLSCFTKLFAEEHGYTHDLGELGRYYRAYEQLMQHWRAMLPAGVMLDVKYEELVADLATQARRLVAHCGLPWDEACLRFDRTERPIRTASATQVRQPIYATSIGRSKDIDRNKLAPLLAALGVD